MFLYHITGGKEQWKNPTEKYIVLSDFGSWNQLPFTGPGSWSKPWKSIGGKNMLWGNPRSCHDSFRLQNHLFRLGTFWGNCDGVWCPRYDLKWNRVNVGLGILNFWERLKISAPSTLRTLVAIYLSTLELFRITLLGGWCDSGQNLKDKTIDTKSPKQNDDITNST